MDAWNLKGGQLKILSQSEIEEIHQRALDVLQQVGCFFESKEALDILEKHGALVDSGSRVAKLPRNMVKSALQLCPSSILLAARDPARDIHDIGKNIVALLMKAAGFDVVDMGVNRTAGEILSVAKGHEVDVLGLSALLTTTIPQMQVLIELLQESGLRDKFKVIVGGAPVTEDFAIQIGVDGYGADATRAVEVIKKNIAK
jgi:methylmalonyl-CoA mutase cobalamin-binding domain/chain